MTHIVRFTPEALNQLDEVESHIVGEGAPIVAARYLDSIVGYCENFPAATVYQQPNIGLFGRRR